MKALHFAFAGLLALSMAGCATRPGQTSSPAASQAALERIASAGPLRIASGRLIADNDAAFASKLDLIERARDSLDLVYFIWSDDYSSSRLSQALLAAAARGVRIRLLLDYHTNYARLDLFSHLEAASGGKIEVRLYNRPTRNIVQDAAYMTLGCPRDGQSVLGPQDCSQAKFDAVARLFEQESIGGVPAAQKNISNINTGASGLLLSGLYSKRADVIAMAIQRGQGIDPQALASSAAAPSAAQREQLKTLAQAYWNARTGDPFQRLQGRLRLMFASAMFGEEVDPLFASFNNLLPVNRELSGASVYDWDHLSDFTHHKLLLADRRWLQMGGRNVEDSYHMRPNDLAKKYVFMDTDLAAELSAGGEAIAATFDRLWRFDTMVASLAEVRQHAPNDFVANATAFDEVKQLCSASAAAAAREACVEREFAQRSLTLQQRMTAQATALAARAAIYERYAKGIVPADSGALSVDGGAALYYLENLHFDKTLPAAQQQRIYGALIGEEAKWGKNIHALWVDSLLGICVRATAASPQRVVLHNAYFFPPAQMLDAFARMTDGRADCANVRVTVLSNSVETTDLNVVNVLARHSMKALFDHLAQAAGKASGARFEYYEYQAPQSAQVLSLHTKFSVLGPDLLVGSANADVRSLMMDTNNAMLVRDAEGLRGAYLQLIDSIIDDARRARSVREDLEAKSRAVLIEEDMATFDRIAEKYRLERRFDQADRLIAKQRLRESLDAAYQLARRSLDPAISEDERRDAQQAFNRLFKTI